MLILKSFTSLRQSRIIYGTVIFKNNNTAFPISIVFVSYLVVVVVLVIVFVDFLNLFSCLLLFLLGDGLIPIHMVFVIAKSYHMMEEINEAKKERLQRKENAR